ncbi:MAG: ABC-type multidrug transport system, ATPase and permease component [Hydrocarboniphaga sp.]|uniref:ATP-binding cassette domain-containing protein n=1 Tax=Hydrocarboniphaga sp. TaxID=2033016 RepID=UPI0026155B58|nr:ABC transporter ATP-binding protein [Hydrocarboniphaga sp.]MDB5971990.1 ABC-type multidrug transport system, ATPase and permease component [Hydrocarboniphaga sp.]
MPLGALTRAEIPAVAYYVAVSLATALSGSLAALLLVPVIQPAGSGGRVFGELQGFGAAAAFMAMSAIFATLRWQAARQNARLVSCCAMQLRRRVHARLVDASLASLSDRTSAEISNVLTYNADVIAQGYNALLQLLVAGVTCVVSLGFALWMSPTLTLAVPLVLGPAVLASRAFGHELSSISRRYVTDMTRLFWLSEDFPRRLRHIRSFERQADEIARYGAVSERLSRAYRRQQELVAAGRLILEMLVAISTAAIFAFAYRWRWVDQDTLIAVCLLLGRLLPYVVSTRQNFQQMRTALPAYQLWRRYIDIEPAAQPMPAAEAAVNDQTLHIQRLRLDLPSAPIEIRDLVLRPGELTLVCGDSGIGKSSLFDVLAGMAAPAEFAARIGGQPVDFDRYRAFVRNGAYLSQGARPWQESVRDGLLWAAPQATDEALWQALQDVGLARTLRQSHAGLATMLGSSASRLSGGEMQRLLLAQVILRRPVIALLDEATSALDAASETAVLARMKHCLPRTILLVISHRPAAAGVADRCLRLASDSVASVMPS